MCDVELGLDTTRSDELGDLEGVGVGGGEHTRQQMGLVAELGARRHTRRWLETILKVAASSGDSTH